MLLLSSFTDPDSFWTIGRKRSTAFFDRTLSTDHPNAFGFWDSDPVRGKLVGLRKTNYNWIGIFRYIHYDPGKNPWESKRIVESFSHFGICQSQGAPVNLIRKSVGWWNALFDKRGVNNFECAARLRLRASSSASYPRRAHPAHHLSYTIKCYWKPHIRVYIISRSTQPHVHILILQDYLCMRSPRFAPLARMFL